jgi:hypothetical protein
MLNKITLIFLFLLIVSCVSLKKHNKEIDEYQNEINFLYRYMDSVFKKHKINTDEVSVKPINDFNILQQNK